VSMPGISALDRFQSRHYLVANGRNTPVLSE
jgi:hypothetical protein